jgi:uncharacterized membrane protein YfcA
MIFGLVGAYMGARLALSVSGLTLKKVFGVFLLIVGCYEMFRKADKRKSIVKN